MPGGLWSSTRRAANGWSSPRDADHDRRKAVNDAKAKTERVLAALGHREPDRVPVGEFFWTNFVKRVKGEWDVGDDFDPYAHWDLDLIVLVPNLDPHITGIRVVEDTGERFVVKTGFEATIELRGTCPMPLYRDFETQTYEQMEALELDDPLDPRRYHDALEDQINSVADALNLGYPSLGDRIPFNGCIDSHHVLIDGTPETVRAATREVLGIMKPGGGFVAGASHDWILPETPLDNVLAIFDTIGEHGVYG